MKKEKPIFKARCSGVQKLLAEKGLGETGKTYVKDWLTEQFCGYRKEFSNKYTKKGLAMENAGIELVSEVLDLGEIIKNAERKENEWLSGECDIRLKESIDDIKCSWDAYTFPLFTREAENKTYIAQGNGYLWLEDKEIFRLHYCLVDAPEWLIDSEYWKAHRNYEFTTGYQLGDEVDGDLYDQVRAKMIHSHIAPEKRVKTFIIKRDEALIQLIPERVELAREYAKDPFNSSIK